MHAMNNSIFVTPMRLYGAEQRGPWSLGLAE